MLRKFSGLVISHSGRLALTAFGTSASVFGAAAAGLGLVAGSSEGLRGVSSAWFGPEREGGGWDRAGRTRDPRAHEKLSGWIYLGSLGGWDGVV